jgi:hypothetical protein
MAAVPPDFLPPDPSAEQAPAPQPAARPVFLPPNAPLPSAGEGQNGRATAAVAFGAGGLGVLALSVGALFFLTIPASIAGWILGVQAKRREVGRDQANVAVILGIVGLVASVIAAAVWIVLFALGEVDDGGSGQSSHDTSVHFDVIRLLALLL